MNRSGFSSRWCLSGSLVPETRPASRSVSEGVGLFASLCLLIQVGVELRRAQPLVEGVLGLAAQRALALLGVVPVPAVQAHAFSRYHGSSFPGARTWSSPCAAEGARRGTTATPGPRAQPQPRPGVPARCPWRSPPWWEERDQKLDCLRPVRLVRGKFPE